MVEDGFEKQNLRQVRAGEQNQLLNPRLEFQKIVSGCIKLIDNAQYADAFETFAGTLEIMERHSPQVIGAKGAQQEARKTLGILWNAFIKDTTDHEKKVARIHALEAKTDQRVKETQEVLKSVREQNETDNERGYRRALAEQRAQSVVAFPNEDSQQADLERRLDTAFAKMGNVFESSYEE